MVTITLYICWLHPNINKVSFIFKKNDKSDDVIEYS